MEGRNTTGFMVILMVFSFIHVFKSEQPVGYIGCYRNDIDRSVTDKNGHRLLHIFPNNSGSLCMRFCMRANIRFAGTQKTFCICVRTMVNAERATICTEPCPGNNDEICGSITGASLYDTKFKPTRSTTEGTRPVATINQMSRRETESTMTTKALVTRKSGLIEASTRTWVLVTAEKLATTGWVKIESALSTESTTDKGKLPPKAHTVKVTKSKHESKGFNNPRKSIYSNTDSENSDQKPLKALYVIIPVVILVSGASALTVYIILRRRRLKSDTKHCRNTQDTGSATVNAFSGDSTEFTNRPSIPVAYTVPSDSSQYCDVDSNALTDAEYTTPVNFPEGHNYAHLKIKSGVAVKTPNYSHLELEQEIPNSRSKTDQVYAHTQIGISHDSSAAAGCDGDVTYNRLHLTPFINIDKEADMVDDQTSVYDHAVAGGDDPKTTDTEYSHLNTMGIKDKNTYQRGFTGNNVTGHVNKDFGKRYEKADGLGHTYFILEPGINSQ